MKSLTGRPHLNATRRSRTRVAGEEEEEGSVGPGRGKEGRVRSSKDMRLSARRGVGGGLGGGGGGGGKASVKKSSGSVTAMTASSSFNSSQQNPTWMRKLEEKYQRLHKKILTIPQYQSATSRVSFLTRKFINDALAKAAANKATHDQTNSADAQQGQDEQDDEDHDRNNNARSSSSNYPSRKSSTVPHSLQTEELLSQPPNYDDENNVDDDDDARFNNGGNVEDTDHLPMASRETCAPCAECNASPQGESGVPDMAVSSRCHCTHHQLYQQRPRPHHPLLPAATPYAYTYTTPCSQCARTAVSHSHTATEGSGAVLHSHHCQNHPPAPHLSGTGSCDCCAIGVGKRLKTQTSKGNEGNALGVNTSQRAGPPSRHWSGTDRVENPLEGNNNTVVPYTTIKSIGTGDDDDLCATANTVDLAQAGEGLSLARHSFDRHHSHHNPQVQSTNAYGTHRCQARSPQSFSVSQEENGVTELGYPQQTDAKLPVPVPRRLPLVTVPDELRNDDGMCVCRCGAVCPSAVNMVTASGFPPGHAGVNVVSGESEHDVDNRRQPSRDRGVGGVQHREAGRSSRASAGWLSDPSMGDISATTANGVPTFYGNSVQTRNHINGGLVLKGDRQSYRKGISPFSSVPNSPASAGLRNSKGTARSRRTSGTVAGRQGYSASRGGRHTMKVFERMSMEARHAVTETLKEMDGTDEQKVTGDDKDEKGGEDSAAGERDAGQREADDVNFSDDFEDGDVEKEDDNDIIPSPEELPPTEAPQIPLLPEPDKSRSPRRVSMRRPRPTTTTTANKNNNSTSNSTTQYLQPPESSMAISHKTVSQKTSTTQQKSFRTTDARQTDNTASSITAAVRGGKSPRRSVVKKPPSTVVTSLNAGRARPKSGKTVATFVAAGVGSSSEQAGRNNRYHRRQQNHHHQHPHHHHPSNSHSPPVHTNHADNDIDLDMLSMYSGAEWSSGSSYNSGRDRGVAADGADGAATGPYTKTQPRLPAITTSRTDPQQHMVRPLLEDSARRVNYRIRGVGSYPVARETTFEITAPDFDIRYRDVITCQKGDRETPPPDIYEKSVGKVKDWLSKYYNNPSSSS